MNSIGWNRNTLCYYYQWIFQYEIQFIHTWREIYVQKKKFGIGAIGQCNIAVERTKRPIVFAQMFYYCLIVAKIDTILLCNDKQMETCLWICYIE